MLKVLHFYKTYYPDTFGGIEQVIYQLSEAGTSHGIDSTTLSLSTRGNIQNKTIGKHRANYAATSFEFASTPFSFDAIKRFKQLAEQADIIHYHFPYPFMDMLHFMCGISKPTVLSYHSDIVKQKMALKFYAPLMDKFLNSVDYIVAATPNYVASSSVLQKHMKKVKVIPYGLDRSSYPTVNDERVNYWKGKVGENFFLFIGAFRYYKGLHILLEAVKSTDLPLVIIGGGTPEAEAQLKEFAAKNNLNNVIFLGALPDIDKVALLYLSYSVVFPSCLRSEAFGITLLEGAMFGKPLICCDIQTGTTFINIDKVTGSVVPPFDAPALRDAMLHLQASPELAAEYGKNALQRFETHFTSSLMSQSYFGLYHSLIYDER